MRNTADRIDDVRATFHRIVTALRRDERGASLVEYALLVALIGLVAMGAVSFFGDGTGSSLDRSSDCIVAAQNGQPLPADC